MSRRASVVALAHSALKTSLDSHFGLTNEERTKLFGEVECDERALGMAKEEDGRDDDGTDEDEFEQLEFDFKEASAEQQHSPGITPPKDPLARAEVSPFQSKGLPEAEPPSPALPGSPSARRRHSVVAGSTELRWKQPSKGGARQRRSAMTAGVMHADDAERLTDAMIDALASNRRGTSTGNERSTTITVRGIISGIALVAMIWYFLTWFEMNDWRHKPSPIADMIGATGKGPMGASGFTGPTVLWAFTALWLLSQTVFGFMHTCNLKFRQFTHEQQIKVVKYWIQLIWGSTSGMLYCVFQMYADGIIDSECTSDAAQAVFGPDPVAEGACMMMWSFELMHVMVLFGSLYIWELIHEGFMIHASMACHHLCILAVWQVICGFYATRHWISPKELYAMASMGFGQMFAAGLEQPTFIALLAHRFGASLEARAKAFRVAWISFAITKLLAFMYTVWMMAVHWDNTPLPFSVLMVAILVAVSITQVYSTLVLRMLSARMTEQKKQAEINKTLRSLQKRLSSVDEGLP